MLADERDREDDGGCELIDAQRDESRLRRLDYMSDEWGKVVGIKKYQKV